MNTLEKLKRAEQLLNEAADLRDEALHMSTYERRVGKNSDLIRCIASSEENGNSLRCVIRDMEYESQEQPVWTQPLTSPKNQF